MNDGGARPDSSPDPDVPSALRASGVHKVFESGAERLHVLRGADLDLAPGEAVAVVGGSGSGKSTLLHLLGALDRPTRGVIEVGGRDLGELHDDELAEIRNRQIGFVFQFHHLLREFSALENVMMPTLIAGTPVREARQRARELLAAVGLADRETHASSELSGGEQQRVAVARALANDPVVLLADEPSGNLDRDTSLRLHDLLFRIRAERGVAMVLVTHNPELARRADRILQLTDGVLISESQVPEMEQEFSEGGGR
ncbi:MAG: ABC transporter ATP-binding protein [Longimicrobiales bacterium]|nr:ABC transporter ATP-binding protein [Longimicrobiales bacterium]